jgi:hypothetical protein
LRASIRFPAERLAGLRDTKRLPAKQVRRLLFSGEFLKRARSDASDILQSVEDA